MGSRIHLRSGGYQSVELLEVEEVERPAGHFHELHRARDRSDHGNRRPELAHPERGEEDRGIQEYRRAGSVSLQAQCDRCQTTESRLSLAPVDKRRPVAADGAAQ